MKNIVVWDLGATKCAAAVLNYDAHKHDFTLQKQCYFKLQQFQSLHDLTEAIESALGLRMRDASVICIGAAGVYDGESLHLQHGYPYAMPFGKIAKEFKWPVFEIIHDYAPIICATFTSYAKNSHNIKKLNQCDINPHGRRVAFGLGTGLGVKDGVLLPDGNFWLGTNEMGHIGIPQPQSCDKFYHERHQNLLDFYQSERLSAETILSGKGMARLHHFLHPHLPLPTPEEVGDIIRKEKQHETLDLFAWYLGLFVGTAQLTFMPEGGIWMTGGVILNHPEVFYSPEFKKGIDATPAYLEKRRQFPMAIMLNADHAFMGGAYYAVKKLCRH